MEMKPRKLKKVGHKGSRCLDLVLTGREKDLMENSFSAPQHQIFSEGEAK